MEYIIQWAEKDDAKALGLIHSSSWIVAYKGIIPDEVLESITPEKREVYFTKAIRYKLEETAVIKSDNQICGFVTLGRCRDEDLSFEHGEIWGIYLSPDYWSKGLGSILLDWAIGELAGRGFKKISLWVLEDNLNARSFYEKHGFGFDGTIKQLNIGKNLNEIRYIKVI